MLYGLDRVYLELLAPSGIGPVADALRHHIDKNGEGLFGLALGTPDLDGTLVQMQARGFPPTTVATGDGHDTATGARRSWRSCVLPLTETRGVLVLGIEHAATAAALSLARASSAEESTLHGIDHAVVRSVDADASIAIWGGKLGLRCALDRRFEAFDARMVFFRVGGVTIEIVAPLDAAADGGNATADTLFGLSWKTANVHAARQRLADSGFDVSPVRAGRRPGTNVFSVHSGTLGIPTLVLGPDV